MGEISALGILITALGRSPAGFFIFFGLIAWTVSGFFALRAFLWNVSGKEIITAGSNSIMIDKKGLLLFKPKEYDLREVKNIRIQEVALDSNGFFGRRNDFSAFNSRGTIRFDYGLQTVKFASGTDVAEARLIIDKLKGRRMITHKNYSSNS